MVKLLTQARQFVAMIHVVSLLPQYQDVSYSVAKVKHVVGRIRHTIGFLNPGQTRAIISDQPTCMYGLTKQIQHNAGLMLMIRICASNLGYQIGLSVHVFNTV